MYLIMLDGKAINSLTNTNSSQTCYLCKSKPTEMNDLSNSKHSNISTDYLQYGLTQLCRGRGLVNHQEIIPDPFEYHRRAPMISFSIIGTLRL